jgi:dienelactone hydrolase
LSGKAWRLRRAWRRLRAGAAQPYTKCSALSRCDLRRADSRRISEKKLCSNVFLLIRGAPRCRQSVAQNCCPFVSTFALDGFTGRGLTQVNTNQALLGRLNFILDIYRALDALAKHPRIDAQRIALMGFSRGGQAVLYASLKRFHKMWNRSGVEFAAYIPFYPDCATTFVSDTEVTDRPIWIFGGTLDDYNPIVLCKAYVERLKAAGRDVQVTEFPNAPHAFDVPLLPPSLVVAGGQTVRHCAIREEPAGLLINASTRQPFTYKEPCVEANPHVGFDPAATEAAKMSVKEILKTVFKL